MLAVVTERGSTERLEFDDFYSSEYGRIVALAYAVTGDRDAAEDAAQDAFLAAHRDWHRIGSYDAPGAWVRRVVLNKSRSRFRRQGRESQALARFAASEPTAVDPHNDDSEVFWRAVRTLPPKLAQCVVLHYVDDLDAAAIGAVLDITPATVRVHLHRARVALAKALDLEEES
jgi:RNA polymerase sigma-70 factor (ECF subfamily)